MKEFGIEKASKKLKRETGRDVQFGKTNTVDRIYDNESGGYIKNYTTVEEQNLGNNREKIEEYMQSLSDPDSENSQIFEKLKGLNESNSESKSAELEKLGLLAEKVSSIRERVLKLSGEKKKQFKLRAQRTMLRLAGIASIVAPIAAHVADKIDFSVPQNGIIGIVAGAGAMYAMSSFKTEKIDNSKVETRHNQVDLHNEVMNKDSVEPIDEME